MNKRPFADEETLRRIIKERPTPFHIYDERGIRQRARELYKAFSWNPGFKEFFAVKATPNPAIMRILKEEGCGMDCSSLTELMLSRSIGVVGDGIMFSSNATPAEEYRLAHELGATINLDDISHIDYFEAVCGGLPKTICCRYNPGGTFRASTQVMDIPGEAKYGFTKPQLLEGMQMLKARGVERFGLHAFLASNADGDAYYPDLARLLFELAVELAREAGVRISFINLSGGIGVPYHPDDRPPDILAIGEKVRGAYDAVLGAAGMGDVTLSTELGRFMLADSGGLVTTVIHEKHIYKDYACVDACACDLMRPAFYGAYHHITAVGKEGAPCTRKYDVCGSLCENNDKFAKDRMLPPIGRGDILWIHDTGAHGHSMGYNYNGKLRSAEILLREDGSHTMIRRAETPADYFATLDF